MLAAARVLARRAPLATPAVALQRAAPRAVAAFHTGECFASVYI